MTKLPEPLWLTRSLLDYIHDDQVERFGGLDGIRDDGLIESALARPRNLLAYDETVDLAHLAAAYVVGLAKNHGYVDGNKRVAFMACYVFLGLNDRRLVATEPEVVQVVTDVAGGKLSS